VNYNRGVDYSQGFNVPMVFDSSTFGVGGLLGRRVSAHFGGGVSWGALGIAANAPEFTVASVTAGMRMALTRSLGIAAQYAYRDFKFDDPASLPPGFRPEAERQSVRVTLDFRVPLLIRARSADAAR
jgi:hypothetical protein